METLELVVLPQEVQEIANLVSKEKREEVNLTLNKIFAGTADWKAQVDAIEVKGVDDVMSIKMADAARLNAKNARLNAEKVFDAKRDEVQQQMQSYQTEDKLWLKAKQTMQILFKDIEDSAKYKSEYVKRYEAEQKELKTLQRINQIQPLAPDMLRSEFENMSDDTFATFVSGLKTAIDKKKEDERIAEEARQEAIRKEAERIEAQRIENERLKAEAVKKELELKKWESIKSQRNEELRPYIIFIRDYNKMLNLDEASYQKELADIKIGAKQQADYEAEQQRLAKIESDKQVAIIEEQRKETLRIAAELKVKKDAEIAEAKQREAAELKAKAEAAKLAQSPIKKQMQIWVNGLSIGKIPEHDTALLISNKFEDFRKWALNQIESI